MNSCRRCPRSSIINLKKTRPYIIVFSVNNNNHNNNTGDTNVIEGHAYHASFIIVHLSKTDQQNSALPARF
jgi:hypothetical protein